MSVEFEKAVMQKLDLMMGDITDLKTDVADLKEDVTVLKTDVADLKEDTAGLKNDVSSLKTNVTSLKKELKEVKEDTAMLKNEMFNLVKPTLKSIEQKVDIMTNINTAKILNNQTRNHEELIEKIEEYEKNNELEHSRLNYEICKLKANT